MFFKSRQKIFPSRHLRERVESCVNTVLAINERLGEGKIKPEVVHQFERLRDSLEYLNEGIVNEQEIGRIEDATNQLLEEVRAMMGDAPIGSLHEGHSH